MSLDRHHEITRIEAFSDAVFALTLTLLVVSLEVHTYQALMLLARAFLPFACCFALLIWICLMGPGHFTWGMIHGKRRKAFEAQGAPAPAAV